MIDREEYLDPSCPLCGKPGETEKAEPVPIGRILDRLAVYEARNDAAGAERHLRNWLAEAEALGDLRGQLSLHNEMMGFYRKEGNREAAFSHAEKALALLSRLGMEDTITAGTTCLNAGTVKEAFGDPVGGLALFERARALYEKNLQPGDARLGGLYNNMGLNLAALGRFGEAETLFRKALEVMKTQPHGELEQAITWLNIADAMEARLGMEEAEEPINACLGVAERLLNTEGLPRDGHYAFVCEKCAPVFGYYGFFAEEQELTGRAKEIYERN